MVYFLKVISCLLFGCAAGASMRGDFSNAGFFMSFGLVLFVVSTFDHE